MDPAAFYPTLQRFAKDKFKPNALLLEYLANSESLNCTNYSDALHPQAIEGIEEIHKAGVHHQDVYHKNILLVRGNPGPGRLVWIDFEVATTFDEFGSKELALCDHELNAIKSFGELLAEGLPPNTKFY
ncbi:serine/threonine protein kinase [Penicillium angulare]|uniref:serine/threonine protein kinase n=1 Tax=Penicillium angulare TaxID=116970 RepID=UPI002540A654|nr:serine/threonine protein kinase [Penicillium angulare]KAJ5273300.1 serine/threonine protein kinase [Penicillium angulare]